MPSIDGIYNALGQGDEERARKISATLLAAVPDSDPRRHAVLQARLDVLGAYHELGKPDGDALHAAIERAAAKDRHEQALADRFAIALAIESRQAPEALARANELLAATRERSRDETGELRFAQARAALIVNGHLDEAREAARAALGAWRGQRGKRGAWHAEELHYLIGNAYIGDRAKALPEFEIASTLAIRAFGADSLTRIEIDNERAASLAALGRSADALALRESILASTRRRFGDNTVRTAKAEAMIGASLQEVGDYPTARAHYAQAEKILKTATDSLPLERALIAGNYANLLQEMGEEEAALAQYHDALAGYADSPQLTRLRAVTYANIGNTEFRMHRYEAAIADFELALGLREQSDGKNAVGLSFSLEGLGSSALALERYADAERYFQRALDVRSRNVAPDHPTLAVYNFGLALAYWGQRRADEALRYAQRTAEGQQAMLATFATEFSERQSVAFRDILVPATALAVTIAAERGDEHSIEVAWRLVMGERRLVARAEARLLAAARSARDPAMARLWEAWRRANEALGEAWLDAGTTGERMTQLRADSESAERALWRYNGHDVVASAERNVTIDDLAKSLPADGLLIAFTEGISGDLTRELVAGNKPAPDVWYAFALGPGGRPMLRRVGNIAALSILARTWYQDVRNPVSESQTLRRDGETLRRALLDPFTANDPKRRIFIVPEGELFRVSFAALPDDRGGYLAEAGMRVHTLAQEGDLLLPVAQDGGKVVLAGAPTFPKVAAGAAADATVPCSQVLASGFTPIPNAQRELDALHALLAPAMTDTRIQMIVGAGATKDKVFAALPRAAIIHIATHGFSLDGRCLDNGGTRGVSLGRVQSGPDAGGPAAAALSGLAFAGTGVTDKLRAAVLSAGELSAADLSDADWVALSACDSGLGPISRNEGVFGMRRALRLAGARTVVMSLWEVDDAATADLMQALYRERFVAHRDVDEAMAAAMQSVLRSRRAAGLSTHPFYWAAFTSEGGWR